MSGALPNILLREIPASLLAGVDAKELKVYGSVIRSLTTGKIVGHLQETSGLAKAAGQLLSAPATMPLQGLGLGIDVAGHAASFVQNEQIKAAISVVQNLQVAELAVGAAGIGVSVAGFAILAAKIARVEAKVDALGGQLDRIARDVAEMRADRVAELFTRLRTAVQQLDEGWDLRDPGDQWRAVATDAHALANLFRRQVDGVLGQSEIDLELAEPFLEAVAIAQSTRVTARLAAGDDLVARRAAEENAATLVDVGERLKVGELTLARMAAAKIPMATADWGDGLKRIGETTRLSVRTIRSREIASVSMVATLAELDRRGVQGRTWLEAARAEEVAPLLFLPTEDHG